MKENNFTLLLPQTIDWDCLKKKEADFIFSERNIDFLNEISSVLLKNSICRTYPDVISFAFFCRKANLLSISKAYKYDNTHIGRGLVFHIAPGNVPVNFAYSFVAGVLSGNNNVIKVSSKEFAQVDIILEAINKTITQEKYQDFKDKFAFIRYERSSNATDFFSSMSDARIIWGGDQTINIIKKSPTKTRCVDVCFSDRYSIALIKTESILEENENSIEKLAEFFYNDTYLFDQNACSAPHLVFWIGHKDIEKAKNKFWTAVHKYVEQHYNFSDIMAVDKETAFYRQAVKMDIKKETDIDNLIYRVELNGEIPRDIPEYRSKCGYFIEHTTDQINTISSIITPKYQTLIYHGFDKNEMKNFVMTNKLKGVDRIVPFGDSTKFSLIWDGYDLISMLSRIQDIL